MSKFKVGDKVKIIGTSMICSRGCGRVECKYLGKIGTIKEINGYKIGVNNFWGMEGKWCSGFEAEVLELIEIIKKEIKVYGIAKFCKKYYK